MNYYQNFNPYMQNQYIQPPRFQTPDQQYVNQFNQQAQQAQVNPVYKPVNVSLQGKTVDSIDVVKAMDIPLDGSISYFPLTDGTAIVTKQLMPNGTSETIVYKPVLNEKLEEKEIPKYITVDEFNEKIKGLDNSKDLKEEIKNLKKQIKTLTDDLEELKEKEN